MQEDEEFEFYSGEIEEIQSDFYRAMLEIVPSLKDIEVDGFDSSGVKKAGESVDSAFTVLITAADIHENGMAVSDIEIDEKQKSTISDGLGGARNIKSLFDKEACAEAINDDGRFIEVVEASIEMIQDFGQKLGVSTENPSCSEGTQSGPNIAP